MFRHGWSTHLNLMPMKRLTTHVPILLILLFISFSCKKDDQQSVKPLLFKSLTASSPAFPHGESVQITADVDGTNITYYWTYSDGEITGSGSSIVYSCDIPGTYNVICTVQDGAGNVDDKQITLQVQ